MLVTEEDFLAYAQIKAYDVISTGQFKRHLSQSRDNGNKWAIDMYQRQSQVQARIRELFSLVSQLEVSSGQSVQRICKDVMTCAQPPVKIVAGHNTCALTGVQVEHCVDLTRVGKNSREVYVHPRFWYFFMMLWFCSKLEYVIRACTKHWLDSARPRAADSRNVTRLCEDYTDQNQELIRRMFQLFVKGMDYVTLSLSVYREKYALHPVLMPSVDYLRST
jgi:hypothetical protein